MWLLGLSLEGMQCYAVLAPDLLRWKIIRRNVCTAVRVYGVWLVGENLVITSLTLNSKLAILIPQTVSYAKTK